MTMYRSVNQKQQNLIDQYKQHDPNFVQLGEYRGRPVVLANTTSWNKDARQHVILILKSGLPGDLPKNWESGEFLHDPRIKREFALAKIRDWESWVVR